MEKKNTLQKHQGQIVVWKRYIAYRRDQWARHESARTGLEAAHNNQISGITFIDKPKNKKTLILK